MARQQCVRFASIVGGRSCRWRGIIACRLHPLLMAGAAHVFGLCAGGKLCRSTAAELHVISLDHVPFQQLACEEPFRLVLEVFQQLAWLQLLLACKADAKVCETIGELKVHSSGLHSSGLQWSAAASRRHTWHSSGPKWSGAASRRNSWPSSGLKWPGAAASRRNT